MEERPGEEELSEEGGIGVEDREEELGVEERSERREERSEGMEECSEVDAVGRGAV